MEITHTIANGLCIIHLKGELSLHDVKLLREYAAPLITDETLQTMIINCKELQFADSLGIGLIINIYEKLQDREKKFILCHLNNRLMDTLELASLDQVLTIFATETDALASLS